ncbi:MAG: cardiolipin synthase [Longimicrobiales bacterium]
MIDSVGALILVAAGFLIQALFAVFVLLRPQTRQQSSLAWILVIVTLPGLGIVLYLILGEVRTGSKRRRRHREIQGTIRAVTVRAWAKSPIAADVPDMYQSLGQLAALPGSAQPHGGNHLRLLARADLFVDELTKDIEGATNHVHLLYYIYLDDGCGRRVATALKRAVVRGVECRLLVDSVGSSAFLKSELCRELTEAGVHVVGALPTRITQIVRVRFDMRNHRKIAVVDGQVGYTGSHNLADEAFTPKPKFAPWIDATVRIEGPGVRDLQALFVEDWFMDTRQSLDHLIMISPTELPGGKTIQVVGTGPNSRNRALVQVIQSAIHLARREIILTTPYFVPDEGTHAALTTAAMRGVRTIVVVPARNDSPLVSLASRSFYDSLLAAGVEVHEFTKGLLHAKTITVDRDLALVSTANFDRRSFEINFELTTLVYDTDFASELRLLQKTYLEDCRRVDQTTWGERAWPRRLAENVAGLVSPLL